MMLRRSLFHRSSTPWLRIALLTAVAIAVHGYHFGADDGAVYLPAIVHAIHPNLYPYGAEFFESHASLSAFTALVGATARIFHLSVEWTVFLWHLVTVYLFIIAAWRLASVCFDSQIARWSALLLSSLTLTVPAAGTALVLMDPYLTARSASTPLSILAIAAFLAGHRREAIFWLALTSLVHPQMALFAAGCLIVLALPARWTAPIFETSPWAGATAAAFPLGFSFTPATSEYHQSLEMRSFLSVLHWRWYEWLGIAAPLAILFAFSRIEPQGTTPAFRHISRALTLFGVTATAIAVVFASTARLETFLRLQPMRAFQLIYIVFFLLLGGLLSEYLLKSRSWLWIALFTSIGAGVFVIQTRSYAQSRHIEWPGMAPVNPWVAAFLWVRENTPPNAVFALDPNYIEIPSEDQHGFRGIAQRSVLTDHFKDSGVVSLFPQLASEWAREQAAQQDWNRFQLADFQQLAQTYPVTWIVLQGAPIEGLNCPYRNQTVAVCQIPRSELSPRP
jgi:hypothetical protein